jgi:hypothetical protein
MIKETIQKLQYFEGKVCTIFLPIVNRQFDEDTARKYFIIRVREIDSEGVWGTNLITGTVSFFSLSQISSIQEELELNPQNAEDLKIIEQYEPVNVGTSESLPTPGGQTKFVDINSLTNMAKLAQSLK